EATSAVVHVDLHTHEPQLSHLLDELLGVASVLVDLRRRRTHSALSELSDGLLQGELVVGEGELHGDGSAFSTDGGLGAKSNQVAADDARGSRVRGRAAAARAADARAEKGGPAHGVHTA